MQLFYYQKLYLSTLTMQELDGKPAGNKILKVGDIIPRAFERKGNSAMSSFRTNQQGEKQTEAGDGLDLTKISEETEAEDPVTSDSVLKGRCVRDVVTPLAKMPYADQLEQKNSSLTRTLKTLVSISYLLIPYCYNVTCHFQTGIAKIDF